MGVLDRIAGWLGYARPRSGGGFAGAEVGRLTASLAADTQFINTTLRQQLRILRARSRQAAQNNPYARRFFQMVVDNVCGPHPFKLQAKVKFNTGRLDDRSNRTIEEEWKKAGLAGSWELSRRWSRAQFDRLTVRTLAIDGEVLIRKYRGPEYGRYGYREQLIDIDRLDDLLNKSLPGGGAIHMGVEVDPVGTPVAFHLLKRKPAQWQFGYTPREHERVPAEEIDHLFVPDFAEQVRGVPWIYAALLNLVHMGAFQEAAVIAARVGAAQMGVFESPDGGKVLADQLGKDAKGNPQIEADPGAFVTAPPGYKLASWNPKYPDAAMGPFVEACLRGIAAGLGVAYHNLANDLKGVNYSSARIGELDERDAWESLQEFWIDHRKQRSYDDWLRMAILTSALPLDLARIERYREIKWQGRRWQWVDPLKEVTAAVDANKHKLKSRTRIIAEGGEDIEDVFDEIAAEEKLAAEKNVKLPSDDTAAPAAKPAKGDDDDEATDKD